MRVASRINLTWIAVTTGLVFFAVVSSRGTRKNGAESLRPSNADVREPNADKYWVNAQEEVDRNVVDILHQHQAELAKGVRYHKLIQGNPAQKELALTFDDGPHPQDTPQLLALLKQYHIKSTFFFVGMMAEKYPDLVKAVAAAGHNIGNHTYHHVNLKKIPQEQVATEIKACGTVLKSILGTAPHLFRPPGGDYNQTVAEAAEALGYTMVLWTDDPGDYASPGAHLVEARILKKIGNGGIILIHDGIQQTIDILPQLITYLEAKGYKFVTIDQMLAHRAAAGTSPRPRG